MPGALLLSCVMLACASGCAPCMLPPAPYTFCCHAPSLGNHPHCTPLTYIAALLHGLLQYKLGAAKLAVRLVNGRLMGRAGAGQQLDLFEWLGKQPVAPT